MGRGPVEDEAGAPGIADAAASAGPGFLLDGRDLRSRLAAQIIARTRTLGLTPGSHLREQELADAFRVSRTPIRVALRTLEERGFLERRSNRGFFLKQVAAEGEGEAVLPPPVNGADEDPLYFTIADDLLSGRLERRVTELELARRYEASRNRITRLLGRMTNEGWIARLPGQGWEFKEVLTSPDAYDQSYHFRILVEPAALLDPAYRMDPAVLDGIRARQHAMLAGGAARWSRSETFMANATFHEAIVAGAANPFLLDSLCRVNRLRRLFEYRFHQFRERLVGECEDHLALLDLIAAGELEAAARALRAHLERARQAKALLARNAPSAA